MPDLSDEEKLRLQVEESWQSLMDAKDLALLQAGMEDNPDGLVPISQALSLAKMAHHYGFSDGAIATLNDLKGGGS